jgi:hypothetical protein
MTQRDHDRLVALKKAKIGVIAHRQAAEEIRQTERHHFYQKDRKLCQ